MFQIAVSCWIKNENKFLLLKRGLHEKWGAGKWMIPGGHLEKGEGIIEGLQRELMEEVGIEIDKVSIRIITNYYFPHKEHDKIVLIVQANLLKGEAKNKDDALEIGWFNKEELSQLELAFETSKHEIELLR